MGNLIKRKLASSDISMLRASLLSGDAAREAFEAWRPSLDWANISRSWQRLMPLLERNLMKEGIDDPLLLRFRGLRRYFWLRNLKQMKIAVDVIDQMRAAAIPVLALKGLSLVACYFSDRSLRPMEDIDLLVKPEHLPAATETLRRLGFDPLNLRHRALVELERRREFAGWPFQNAQGDYFDLHWSALHLDRRRQPDGDLWNSAKEVEVDERKILVMDAADQFIHACAHAVQDQSASALRAVADCATIVAGEIDEVRLQRRAEFHRLTPAVSDMVDLLVNDIGVEAARSLQKGRGRSIHRIDLHLASGSASAGTKTKNILRQAALMRRGDDALFDQPLAASVWRVLSHGRRDLAAPLKQWLFSGIGRPSILRKVLASDSYLLPIGLYGLPVLSQDIISDGLWAGLGPGWSVDENSGRWTIGASASLWWRLPQTSRGNVVLMLRRERIGLTKRPVQVEIRANDVRIGKFSLAETDDFPDKLNIPFKAIHNQRALVVSLNFPKTVRPAELGLSDDRRALGLLITSAKASEMLDE